MLRSNTTEWLIIVYSPYTDLTIWLCRTCGGGRTSSSAVNMGNDPFGRLVLIHSGACVDQIDTAGSISSTATCWFDSELGRHPSELFPSRVRVQPPSRDQAVSSESVTNPEDLEGGSTRTRDGNNS